MYEMLSGKPPFYSRNKHQIIKNIVERRVPMKAFFSPEAKSLLRGLLDPDVSCFATRASSQGSCSG